MTADASSAEPITATVSRDASGWVARVYGTDTRLLSEAPLAWGGVNFYTEGLDAVALAGAIPPGYAYEGAQAWEALGDDSYGAVLHRLDPRMN